MDIDQALNGQPLYFVYACKEFDPHSNPSASNPLELYRTLRVASRGPSVNQVALDKVEEQKSALRQVIERMLGSNDPVRADELKRKVTAAELALFHPEVWQIHMDDVAQSQIHPGDGFNEFTIRDLAPSQFLVGVIEP